MMKYSTWKNQKGFTLVELIVTIGILAILLGMITLNLGGIERRTTINASVDTLISDLKQQQIKAMVGDTEGRVSNDNYGIHFESNRYILFHGNSYSSSDTSNFPVNLSSGTNITNILFSNSDLIFASVSGEIVGFTPGQNSVTITNSTDGQQKSIIINKYGAVTAVN